METAKVDIRKLQLLNDRINQCIDALSQVRLSVHGLSHTQAPGQFAGQYPGQVAGQFGNTNPIGGYLDPRFTDPRFGFGVSPIAQGQGYVGGLAHTPFAGQTGQIGQIMPGFTSGMAGNIPLANQIPVWNAPFGLSHTGLETESVYNRPLWTDPFLAVKVSQTFPYAQFPLPPVVPVY
jgi:hypothetical protein